MLNSEKLRYSVAHYRGVKRVIYGKKRSLKVPHLENSSLRGEEEQNISKPRWLSEQTSNSLHRRRSVIINLCLWTKTKTNFNIEVLSMNMLQCWNCSMVKIVMDGDGRSKGTLVSIFYTCVIN